MIGLLREIWCGLAHGGGNVKRDAEGRINWQCSTCGRWSTPVPLDVERNVIDRDIAERRKQKGGS